MSTFKCKMCGGALEITDNASVATCEYCGTQQTLPKLDDDRRANLYDRANHFRRNNEFDKAMGIYEQILNEDTSDAEAYWSLVLCRYGIEYVEDPTSHKRVPTVNRAQFTSVFDDDNFKSALQYADSYQRGIYEAEAKAINEIQKGILAISEKEEPFDVFICYKEADNNGRRTPDSVLANDLYHQLTLEGFKVFFARITLEDKLGTAYEPYIFAALNSAKVMVVLGTKPEHFNAVWVKNEWSRYLALIKQGQRKTLIPAYKDMDPYDLPEEFSHLQAQDMSKLGFMQDLIRGIKKIAQADAPKQATAKETVVTAANANTAPLLKRAFMFLEDGEWDSADEYCERVLDIDPENAQAYLGKVMVKLKCKSADQIAAELVNLDSMKDFSRAIKFAKGETLENLQRIKENSQRLLLYRQLVDGVGKLYNKRVKEETRIKEEETRIKTEKKKLDRFHILMEQYEEIKKCKQVALPLPDLRKKYDELSGQKHSDTDLLHAFPGIMGDLNTAESEITVAKEKIISLQEEYKTLGFFSIKRKKAIDNEIPLLQGNIESMTKKTTELQQRLRGYTSTDEIQQQIRELVSQLNTLGEKIVVAKEAEKKLCGEKSIFQAIHDEKLSNYIFSEKQVGFLKPYLDYQSGNGKLAELRFGKYAETPIDWLVLKVQDGRALLISKYALERQPYDRTSQWAKWENCSLRKWLNDVFINTAFNAEEQTLIPTVTVSADKNRIAYEERRKKTSQGWATQDKVFLLSIIEANKYFNSDSERMCKSIDDVAANGAYVNDSNGKCRWWLRTIGYTHDEATYVDSSGRIDEYGCSVDSYLVAVRLALWINLDS